MTSIDGAARSPYGAIKAYTGIEGQPGGGDLTFSYGLQLGKASPGVSLDYTKHFLDATFTREWFPTKDRHKSIAVEARFTAGFSTGTLPLVERFWGGNQEQYFINGDSWQILDEPFIRSFSANRFAFTNIGIFGGDSFLSTNATVAYPFFYHRPLVPKVILQDPDFAGALDGALNNSTRVLENSHLSDVPQFVAFRKDVLSFVGPLQDLRQALNQLGATSTTKDALQDLNDLDVQFQNMRDPKFADPSAPVVWVAVGFPDRFTDALLVTLADDLDSVVMALPTASPRANDLRTRQTTLRNAVQDPATGFTVRYSQLDLSIAKQEAAAEMKLPISVLHRFLNELNLASISPVVFTDAARLQSHLLINNPGWRYGLGPGVRFSLINVNLTLGYSFNIARRAGEPIGAFNVGLSFGDLFR